jgi:hypothetical protein
VRETDHFINPGVDGMIILKWILSDTVKISISVASLVFSILCYFLTRVSKIISHLSVASAVVIIVRKREEKLPLERPSRGRYDNIKTDTKGYLHRLAHLGSCE